MVQGSLHLRFEIRRQWDRRVKWSDVVDCLSVNYLSTDKICAQHSNVLVREKMHCYWIKILSVLP